MSERGRCTECGSRGADPHLSWCAKAKAIAAEAALPAEDPPKQPRESHACPFCGERDFDLPGLAAHVTRVGYCPRVGEFEAMVPPRVFS